RRVDQGPERRPRRRAQGRGHPRRGRRARRARHRRQRRHGAVAGRRVRRTRPARAAGRHPRAARGGLRRGAHGLVTVGPAFPAAPRAWALTAVTGPSVHGIVNCPRGWLTEIVWPFTTAVTVAGSVTSKRSAEPSTTVSAGPVVSIVTGWSSETVP